MTLPPSYNSSREYFSDCLNFLKSFSWLYNYHNTYIIVKRILTYFPSEWILYFKDVSYNDLTRLLEGEMMENCPKNLKDLISKTVKLKPTDKKYSQTCNSNFVHNSGLSRKKLHEIIALAPLIDNVCKDNNANIIIDVGAGLGYLSHLLYDNYKHTVLGIECSSQYIDMAYKNQTKFYANAKDHVKFAEHYIDQNSEIEIITLLEKYFPNIPEKSVCISGLHACADLSITILDLFTKLEFVKCLVIMPCCYHRIHLQSSEGEKEYFSNFPASKLFRNLFDEFDAGTFLTRPFLRLACQQSMEVFKNMSADDHERHSKNCMYRAILQEVVELDEHTLDQSITVTMIQGVKNLLH